MIKVAVQLPATIADVGEFIADVRALDAAGADTILFDGDLDPAVVLGAIAAVTHRARLGTSAPLTGSIDTLQLISRDRVALGDVSNWKSVPMPPDRESWTAALRAHEDAGATGIIVPWDARLIDLLRNPEPDDRSDLLMSTG